MLNELKHMIDRLSFYSLSRREELKVFMEVLVKTEDGPARISRFLDNLLVLAPIKNECLRLKQSLENEIIISQLINETCGGDNHA